MKKKEEFDEEEFRRQAMEIFAHLEQQKFETDLLKRFNDLKLSLSSDFDIEKQKADLKVADLNEKSIENYMESDFARGFLAGVKMMEILLLKK